MYLFCNHKVASSADAIADVGLCACVRGLDQLASHEREGELALRTSVFYATRLLHHILRNSGRVRGHFPPSFVQSVGW